MFPSLIAKMASTLKVVSDKEVTLKYATERLEVYRWLGYGFSLDRELKYFPKLLERAKQPELRF